MRYFDALIDRQTIRGLDSVEVARMIGANRRPLRRTMDEEILRDIGFSRATA